MDSHNACIRFWGAGRYRSRLSGESNSPSQQSGSWRVSASVNLTTPACSLTAGGTQALLVIVNVASACVAPRRVARCNTARFRVPGRAADHRQVAAIPWGGYVYVKSGRWDSNPRRPAWEAGILPLNYARIRNPRQARIIERCAPPVKSRLAYRAPGDQPCSCLPAVRRLSCRTPSDLLWGQEPPARLLTCDAPAPGD